MQSDLSTLPRPDQRSHTGRPSLFPTHAMLPFSSQALPGFDGHALPRVNIHDCPGTEPSSIAALIGNEIHGPCLVRSGCEGPGETGPTSYPPNRAYFIGLHRKRVTSAQLLKSRPFARPYFSLN
ncbi:hypothetical protein HNQ77_003816 [Silvibacterium bohemicum]|uniref:Uncharacterized protein n=1 Tax=Silvibacterium bohemicum TaxID=1577686 RepID=A0A841JWX5_9BACT|nr:hypothetical protein [Silvibacterium bohemicum]